MSTDQWGGFDHISLKLFHFLMDNVMVSETPLTIRAMCREFMDNTGSTETLSQVTYRASTIKTKIHELKELDMETKVRMLFGLSVPVDEYFMKEILESEDVKIEVDDRNRIIKYEKKGGLKLSGQHSSIGYRGVSDDDRDIHRKLTLFLSEKSKITASPISSNRFLLDFKKQTGDINHVSRLLKRYNTVRSSIYRSMEHSLPHRIKMMFVSGAKVPDIVLKELQKDATISLDNENRIIDYIANNGSLELSGEHAFVNKKGASKRRSGVLEDLEVEVEEEYFEEEDSVDRPRSSRKRRIREHSNSFDDFSAKRTAPTETSYEPSTSGTSFTTPTNPVRSSNNFGNQLQFNPVFEEQEEADDELVYEDQSTLPYVLPMRRPMENEMNDTMAETIKVEQSGRDQIVNYTMQNNGLCVPETVGNRNSSSQQVDDIHENFTSAQKVLGALRSLVCTLDSPILEQLQQNIQEAIRDKKNDGCKVPFDALAVVVQSSLVIGNISASEGIPLEGSENLREFLRLYQCSLYSLDSPHLSGVHTVFRDYIDKLRESHKRITVKKIRAVIESVLALVVE